LEQLFIDGNDLVDIKIDHLRQTLPKLKAIGLSDNKWNCSFLTKLVIELRKHTINYDDMKGQAVTNRSNVNGIFCDKGVQNWEKPKMHDDSRFEQKQTDDIIKSEVRRNIDDFVTNYTRNVDVIANETKVTKDIVDDIKGKLDKFNDDLIAVKHKMADLALNATTGALDSVKMANEMKQMMENAGNTLKNSIQINFTALANQIDTLQVHFDSFKFKTHKTDKEAIQNIEARELKMEAELSSVSIFVPLFLVILVIALINSIFIGYGYYKLRLYRLGDKYRVSYRSESVLGSDILADVQSHL
jgi:hypothetical protein